MGDLKIYIMTDMEGVSGICDEQQVVPGTSAYEAARHLLSADVNAAIAGAFDGGASEVVVNDGHHSGLNLILPEMDARAVYERPNGGRQLMPSLDESFSGVFCIGYHAMAGTPNAFLDHTQSSNEWYNYYINERRMGELAQIGLWAGSCNVPILMVSGDQAACDEGEAFFTGIQIAAVKQGIGRQRARLLPPIKAQEMIRKAAKDAMALVGHLSPFKVGVPLRLKLEYCRSDHADMSVIRTGATRVDARTVEQTVHSPRDLLNI